MPATPVLSSMQNRETTPETISDDIVMFAEDLGLAPPVYVPVSPPSDALVGDRFQNVERQCHLRGGTPLFGRVIWSADDLYLVGESYCVVSTAQGLIDVTPTPMGETRTLFASYPSLQDSVDLHGLNLRARVYGAAERKAELEGKLLDANDADAASARKNGITVRQLLLSKLLRDPLAAQIDDYLRAEGKLEAVIVSAHTRRASGRISAARSPASGALRGRRSTEGLRRRRKSFQVIVTICNETEHVSAEPVKLTATVRPCKSE